MHADLDASSKRVTRIGNVEIRPAEFQVLVDGRRVGLTVREFELFLLLAERLDSVVQRPEIYALDVGRRDAAPRPLGRRADPPACAPSSSRSRPSWRYIHTHFGIGYRFTPEPSAD